MLAFLIDYLNNNDIIHINRGNNMKDEIFEYYKLIPDKMEEAIKVISDNL